MKHAIFLFSIFFITSCTVGTPVSGTNQDSQSSNTESSSSVYNPPTSSSTITLPSSDANIITGAITASRVTTEGYKLKIEDQINGQWVNKRDYIIKGVNWQPVEIGANNQNTNYSGRVDEDADMMAAAHINTVRIFRFLDRTPASLTILDKLFARGIRIIMVNAWGGNTPSEVSQNVDYFKNHPAILAWMVGNEFNYNGFYHYWPLTQSMTYAGTILDAIKTKDTNHPTILGWGEPRWDYGQWLNQLNYDILAAQVYGGYSFSDLFAVHKNNSTKPLFLSEYGCDGFNTNINAKDESAQAFCNKELTQEIRDNLAANNKGLAVGIGGTIFEWSDEWWKADGGWDVQDNGGHAPGGGPHPDKTFNEEHWGIVDVYRTPKQAYYAMQDVYATY